MTNFIRAVLTISTLLSTTYAHIEMIYPYPLKSKFDPANKIEGEKDYSNKAPLLSSGSNFPCKNYQVEANNDNAEVIKATWTAGCSYNITLDGTATHEGGSCQLLLSYDNGATFKVIQSMIGGCPLTSKYNFTIPSFAPASGSVLFAWTWFSRATLNEMYMNCARVEIQRAPVIRRRKAPRPYFKRQTSMNDLPDLFACAIGNGCLTTENADVQFPDPGDNIIYGTDSQPPMPGPGFVQSGSSTIPSSYPSSNLNRTNITSTTTSLTTRAFSETSSVSATLLPVPEISNTSMSTITITTTSGIFKSTVPSFTSLISYLASPTVSTSASLSITSTSASLLSMAPTSSLTSSTSSAVPNTSMLQISLTTTQIISPMTIMSLSSPATSSVQSSPSTSPVPLTSLCTPGTFACNSRTSFSQCVIVASGSTSYTFMGSVAAGMWCVNGDIIRQNDGPCTPSGALVCNRGYAFYMCDQGGLINMGPVAPGTMCAGGNIQRRRRRVFR